MAQALQGHGLPVLQLPRAKNAGREMAAVMKSFTTSEEQGTGAARAAEGKSINE